MNKKAQVGRGFALMIVLGILFLSLFGLINPFKVVLDSARGGDKLNCPGHISFNETAYDLQTPSEKVIYRPTCFVTGISMVWFVCSFLIAGVVWLARNWK